MANRPEQDIAQMETLLRQLEKEYDQFLCGLLRREPAATENAVLALVRLYASRPIQNSTLAFKYNTLVARYNSFKSVWVRKLREREEGRGPGCAGPPRASAPRVEPRPVAPAIAPTPEFLTADPMHEQRHLRQFYEAYRRQREECGESTQKLRPESFQKALADKVEKIKREQGCEAVLVRVVTEQGRTRLVAKPFRRASARRGAAP